MKRSASGRLIVVGCVVIFTCGRLPKAYATEQGRQSTKPPATSTPSAVLVPPTMMSVEGIITERYPYGKPQRLLLTGADGKEVILSIDPTGASIWKDGQPATFGELQDGNAVKVEYMEKDGVKWMKTLKVVQAALSPSTSLAPSVAEPGPVTAPADQPTPPDPTSSDDSGKAESY